MASVIPISSEAEARNNLARQLSGTSDRLGKKLFRIGGSAAAIFIAIAALFPIDSGAMAPGMELVENKRKTVQHPDGGIIRQILVHEGSVVKAGQPLISIDDTNARTNVSIFQTQSDSLRAERATLQAQLLGPERDQPSRPISCNARAIRSSPASSATQRAAFEARRDIVSGRRAQFSEQIAQLDDEISGEFAGATARAEQIRLLDSEISDVSELLAKGYATKTRLLALQRAAAQLRGEKGRPLCGFRRSSGPSSRRSASCRCRRSRIRRPTPPMRCARSKASSRRSRTSSMPPNRSSPGPRSARPSPAWSSACARPPSAA